MANYCLTIMGAKGGVGATICAVNLATALYLDTKKKVLLLDLDMVNAGDLRLLMGAKEIRPAIELQPVAHKLHEGSVGEYIARHKSGIWMLPAISDPRQAEHLDMERFSMMLQVLRRAFNYIVVDCGPTLNAANFETFKYSSATLLVLTPDILVLSQALAKMRTLVTMQYPQQMIVPLVNKYQEKGLISKSVFKTKLKRDPIAFLPEDAEGIEHSVHENVPIVAQNPRAPFSRAIENMSHMLFSEGLVKPVKGFSLQSRDLPLVTIGSQRSGISSSGTGKSGGEEYLKRMNDMEYDRISDLKMKVHTKLIEVLNLKGINTAELSATPEKLAELKEQVRDAVANIVQEQAEIKSIEERQKVSKEVLDEALGLGPLEDILADDTVSELMVNRKDQIYVEKNGKLILSGARFTSDKHLLAVIERIVAPVGRRIDEKTPMVDARLKDGSRVHAIIPPLSVQGPMLTIRKFGHQVTSYKDLIRFGTLTEEMAQFLKACVRGRLNIIISGGTGTGKTTLLNILGSFISPTERIITVEDAAELNLPQEHVGRLEARPPNLQGEGAIPIRELVRNTLRMRPDRILIGECRGAEALDMLQAMNTGHDGSLTTLHANTPRDCVSRLETLVMFAGMDLPSKAIREQISSAVHLIVQLNRFSDGSRKITAVTEVTGMEGQTITLQDIFIYKRQGLDNKGKVRGKYATTGLIPTFVSDFQEMGINIPPGLFGEVSPKKKGKEK